MLLLRRLLLLLRRLLLLLLLLLLLVAGAPVDNSLSPSPQAQPGQLHAGIAHVLLQYRYPKVSIESGEGVRENWRMG